MLHIYRLNQDLVELRKMSDITKGGDVSCITIFRQNGCTQRKQTLFTRTHRYTLTYTDTHPNSTTGYAPPAIVFVMSFFFSPHKNLYLFCIMEGTYQNTRVEMEVFINF